TPETLTVPLQPSAQARGAPPLLARFEVVLCMARGISPVLARSSLFRRLRLAEVLAQPLQSHPVASTPSRSTPFPTPGPTALPPPGGEVHAVPAEDFLDRNFSAGRRVKGAVGLPGR